MTSKINTINLIIDKHKPEAFFISEAELTDTNISWCKTDGYDLIVPQIPNPRIACYVVAGSTLSLKPDAVIDNNTQTIVLEDPKRRIAGYYKPFKVPEGQTKNVVDGYYWDALNQIASTNKNLWIMGDFNVNLRKASPDKTRLQEWRDEKALKQLVKTDTWSRIITKQDGTIQLRTSLLDHVYTNTEGSSVAIEDKWTSDHNLVVLNLPNKHLINRQKTKVRSWKKYSPQNLHNCLANAEIQTVTTTDVNQLNQQITDAITAAMEELCPLRVIRLARSTDIISDDIERVKKKRKRKMHQYNKDPQPWILAEIIKLDSKLKRKISEVRKNLVRSKMKAGNPKSFWNTVKKLQGDVQRGNDVIELQLGNDVIRDPQLVVDNFVAFFSGKVKGLSGDAGPYLWAKSENLVSISLEEVINATKSLKSKMCTGHDMIPLKILKDAVPALTVPILALMNQACKQIPESWKLSIVTPLHKSKNKSLLENYRPISNLVSVSKLFEKIILGKIDLLYPGIEGQHQHGFRTNRGAHTALLELQGAVSGELDANRSTTIYSIDMSAAFDLLRPNVFHSEVDGIDDGIMNVLMDFMSGRRIKVKLGGHESREESINVGCVQGSILGPKLFNIYCSKVVNAIEDAKIISYADDSYVINSDTDIERLIKKTETCFSSHTGYLKSIGMVVNDSKTEMLYATRDKTRKSVVINVSGTTVSSTPKIKALGVQISDDLSWNDHVDYSLKRSRHIVPRIKYLRKWLNTEELLRLITSQYFSIVYYCCPLWIGSLTSTAWKRINSAHYRALRAVYGDYKMKLKRAELDKMSKRATPKEWAQYSIAATVIKMFNSSDTEMGHLLRRSVYINDRNPGKGKFIDKSRLKIGRQSLPYRIGPTFAKMSFDWVGFEGSDDALRRNLKKEFFKYFIDNNTN